MTNLTRLRVSKGLKFGGIVNSFLSLTNLTDLDFDSDLLLNEHLSLLPNLTRLVLKDSNITDTALLFLTNLKYLDLSDNYYITDQGLLSLSSLTSLCIRENILTGAYLHMLPNLVSLGLIENASVASHSIGMMTNLTKLHLEIQQNVNNYSLMKLTNLTDLTVRYCQRPDDLGICNLTKLKKLEWSICSWISGTTLKNLTNITDLSLSFFRYECTPPNDEKFKELGEGICALHQLVRLSLFDSRVLLPHQTSLKKLPYLTELKLLRDDESMTPECLLQLTQLSKLSVGTNPMIDDSVIMKFTNLHSLNICAATNISDHGIRLLTKLSNLEVSFDLSEPNITLEGIWRLTNLTKLPSYFFLDESTNLEELIHNFPFILHHNFQEIKEVEFKSDTFI